MISDDPAVSSSAYARKMKTHLYKLIFKMISQQPPKVEQRLLLSLSLDFPLKPTPSETAKFGDPGVLPVDVGPLGGRASCEIC